jgi:hypothetical protein
VGVVADPLEEVLADPLGLIEREHAAGSGLDPPADSSSPGT